jgi:hypothetical protein
LKKRWLSLRVRVRVRVRDRNELFYIFEEIKGRERRAGSG